jgi:hypothetical protein
MNCRQIKSHPDLCRHNKSIFYLSMLNLAIYFGKLRAEITITEDDAHGDRVCLAEILHITEL